MGETYNLEVHRWPPKRGKPEIPRLPDRVPESGAEVPFREGVPGPAAR